MSLLSVSLQLVSSESSTRELHFMELILFPFDFLSVTVALSDFTHTLEKWLWPSQAWHVDPMAGQDSPFLCLPYPHLTQSTLPSSSFLIEDVWCLLDLDDGLESFTLCTLCVPVAWSLFAIERIRCCWVDACSRISAEASTCWSVASFVVCRQKSSCCQASSLIPMASWSREAARSAMHQRQNSLQWLATQLGIA